MMRVGVQSATVGESCVLHAGPVLIVVVLHAWRTIYRL